VIFGQFVDPSLLFALAFRDLSRQAAWYRPLSTPAVFGCLTTLLPPGFLHQRQSEQAADADAFGVVADSKLEGWRGIAQSFGLSDSPRSGFASVHCQPSQNPAIAHNPPMVGSKIAKTPPHIRAGIPQKEIRTSRESQPRGPVSFFVLFMIFLRPSGWLHYCVHLSYFFLAILAASNETPSSLAIWDVDLRQSTLSQRVLALAGSNLVMTA